MKSLKYLIEAQVTGPTGHVIGWDAIAAFDCEKPARDYATSCGNSGGADLYRLSLRSGFSWTVIATTGKAAAALDAATARNHPAARVSA